MMIRFVVSEENLFSPYFEITCGKCGITFGRPMGTTHVHRHGTSEFSRKIGCPDIGKMVEMSLSGPKEISEIPPPPLDIKCPHSGKEEFCGVCGSPLYHDSCPS